MKRYLVTGGLGHIGSHVVDALIDRGDEVVIVDNLLTGVREHKHPKAELVECSVADICEHERIRAQQFDGVFHLAAFSNVRTSTEHPLKANQHGANLTVAALELCKQMKIPKMVFISSVVVEYNPYIPYGIEKDAGERYCRHYEKHHGINVSIIRLQSVYGSPRHAAASGNVIPSFIDQKKRLGKITISGDGSQTRDFVYYTDIVAAILEAEYRTGTTEVGSCVGNSILEVAKYFECPIEFTGKAKGEIDQQVSTRSDYPITVPFKEGIHRVVNEIEK